MKRILISIAALVLGAAPLSAKPNGGPGPGGGGCVKCDCVIVGMMGGKSCGCQSTSWGGSDCIITFDYATGASCTLVLGPCTEPILGFAP